MKIPKQEYTTANSGANWTTEFKELAVRQQAQFHDRLKTDL